MSHARQQIREAIQSELTGLTTTGSNVFVSRAYPVNDESLPCLKIYNGPDEMVPEASSMGDNRAYNLAIIIEVKVRPAADVDDGLTNYDDLLDTICAEVQAALTADDTLGGLVKDMDLVSTEFEADDETENETGSATMVWSSLYRIDRTDPETIIA